MDGTLGYGEDSLNISDWMPQEESPPEKQVCLCSRMSKDMGEHDPVMCEWYSAIDGAAKLTGLPSGLEGNYQDGFNSVGEPDAMMTEPEAFAGEKFGFGIIGPPPREYVPGWAVLNSSDLVVGPPLDDKLEIRDEDIWDQPEPYDLQKDVDKINGIMNWVPPIISELEDILNDAPGPSTPLTHGPIAQGDDDQQAVPPRPANLDDTADSWNLAQRRDLTGTMTNVPGPSTPARHRPITQGDEYHQADPPVHAHLVDPNNSWNLAQWTHAENPSNDAPGPMISLIDGPDMQEYNGQQAAPQMDTDLDDTTDGQNPAQWRDSIGRLNDALVPTTPWTHGLDTQGNHDQQATPPTDMYPDDTTCGQVSAKRRDPDARRQKKRVEHKQRMERIISELNRRGNVDDI